MYLIADASGVAIYGGIIATLAFVIALASLIWNIVNALVARSQARLPDVHATLWRTRRQLVFYNSGPATARHLVYLLVENGEVYQGSLVPFLRSGGEESAELPFASVEDRSTFVWAYMDIDHNVHCKSNGDAFYIYQHPTRVEIGEVFTRFYPDVEIPPRDPITILGAM